jgi:hypothetical protein
VLQLRVSENFMHGFSNQHLGSRLHALEIA